MLNVFGGSLAIDKLRRAPIPSIVNLAIALFDLLNTARTGAKDQAWPGFRALARRSAW